MSNIIAFAKLHLAFDVDAIASEIDQLSSGWKAHFNAKNYTGRWEVISLRCPGGNINNIIPDMISEQAYKDTVLMENCDGVKKLVSQLYCEVMSVRLMNLPPGSSIKQHTDPELSFEQGEARLHFPIRTNHLVDFKVDGKRVQMEKGSAWYINANLPHSVTNNGDCDRIHLVIDCRVNEWLQSLFAASEKQYADNQKSNSQQLLVIEALRNQNTDTANRLADKLEKELSQYE